MDVIKLAGEIYGGVLVKIYSVYKKWFKEWTIALWLGMNYNTKFYRFSEL